MKLEDIDRYLEFTVLRLEYGAFPGKARRAAAEKALLAIGAHLGRMPADNDPCEVAAVAEQTFHVLRHPRSPDTLSPRALLCLQARRHAGECFGRCPDDEICRECDYYASCRLVHDTRGKKEHLGYISFENVSQRLGVETDMELDDDGPRDVDDALLVENDALAEESFDGRIPPDLAPVEEFCRFILGLDDYTLRILGKIIVRSRRDDAHTVAALARSCGVSKQRMHCKMLASVRRYPKLATTFACVVRKIAKSRKIFKKETCDDE